MPYSKLSLIIDARESREKWQRLCQHWMLRTISKIFLLRFYWLNCRTTHIKHHSWPSLCLSPEGLWHETCWSGKTIVGSANWAIWWTWWLWRCQLVHSEDFVSKVELLMISDHVCIQLGSFSNCKDVISAQLPLVHWKILSTNSWWCPFRKSSISMHFSVCQARPDHHLLLHLLVLQSLTRKGRLG